MQNTTETSVFIASVVPDIQNMDQKLDKLLVQFGKIHRCLRALYDQFPKTSQAFTNHSSLQPTYCIEFYNRQNALTKAKILDLTMGQTSLWLCKCEQFKVEYSNIMDTTIFDTNIDCFKRVRRDWACVL